MSWADVDKKQGSNAGRFLQFPEGDGSVLIRVLDEEPHTIRVHKITQNVRKGDKIEEVFRSIPATQNPDDNYILKNNPTRYPDVPNYCIRVHQYKHDGAKFVDEGETKILQGGPAIFKPLRALFTDHGHLGKFDIRISRKGKQRDTEYTVTAEPFSKNVNLAELQAKLAADPTWKWENIFVPITPEEQQKIVAEAGFDIKYDPAAALAATMPIERALAATITFGKYKGKTVGEIQVIDASYLSWAADNVTSSDELAAACRVAVNRIGEIAKTTSAQQVAIPTTGGGTTPTPSAPSPTSSTTPAKPAAAPVSEEKAKRDGLVEGISEILETNAAYADMKTVVEIVRKHGGGKSRLKELSVDQLNNLYRELVSG